MRGLECLFQLLKESFKSKEDALVVALHCFLTNEDCKCVGIGEKWDASSTTPSSEILPDGWNNDEGAYAIRYIGKDGARLLLKVVCAETVCMVVLINIMDKSVVGDLTVATGEIIGETLSYFHTTYKNLDNLELRLGKELLPKVPLHKRKEKARSPLEEDPDPLRVPGTSHRPPREPDWFIDPDYGRSDLDPLGGMGRGRGGGMIFDPTFPRMPRFDPGMPRPPPGARYDPFRPPVPDQPPRFRGRDPDNILPREYDDMFG